MRTLTPSSLCAVAALLGSCDSATDPGSAIDHLEVRLTPVRSSYPVPDSAQASVVAVSREGTWLRAGTPVWRSLHPTIATIDAGGRIRTRSRGEATIEVEVDGVTSEVRVPVRGIVHNEYIMDANETWRVADTPHVVTRYLSVGGVTNSNATDTAVLTIEPGVSIRFRSGAGLLFGDIEPGALVIPPGGDPVTFEGDSAARGYWVGVAFDGRGRSELRNLTIRHCGAKTPSGATTACLTAAATELLIDGVTVSEAHDGVDIGHGVTFLPGSRNLSIENTTGHMATVSPQVVATFPRGGHFTGNVEDEIRITIGRVERSATWQDLGAPLRLLDRVLFEGSARPKLTLAPGFVLRSDPQGALTFEVGRLEAGAPGGPPVVLESTGDGWSGISLGTGGRGSALRNVILRDCGLLSGACVRVDGYGAPEDPELVVQDVTLRGSRSVGIRVVGGTFSPSSSGLIITESADVPVDVTPDIVPSIPPGTYHGNAVDAIRVRGGAVSLHATWRNPGMPYLLPDGLSVSSGISPDSAMLTLEPGVVLQLGVGSTVAVGNGAFRAVGTGLEPIVFASATPGVAGSWVGLVVGTSTRAQLEYVEIQDAGAGPHGFSGALRLGADSGGVLRNSVIRRSASCGIIMYGTWGDPVPWTDNYADPAYGNAFIEVAGPSMCPPFP